MKKLLLFLLTLGLISFGYSASATEGDQTDTKANSTKKKAAEKHPTLFDIRKAIVERHSHNKWKTNYETRWYREEAVIQGVKKSFFNYVIVERSKKSALKRETLYKIEMDGEIPKTVEIRRRGVKILRARNVKEFIRISYNPLSKEQLKVEAKAIIKEDG